MATPTVETEKGGTKGRQPKYALALANGEGVTVTEKTLSMEGDDVFGGGRVEVSTFEVLINKERGISTLIKSARIGEGDEVEVVHGSKAVLEFLNEAVNRYVQASAKVKLSKRALGLLDDVVESVQRQLALAEEDGETLDVETAIKSRIASFQKRNILPANIAEKHIAKVRAAVLKSE
jgi:hypothetical protein